jgi:hypothetical protein
MRGRVGTDRRDPANRWQHHRVSPEVSHRLERRIAETSSLFAEDFLYLADFLLDLPTDLFKLPFGF